MSEMSSTFTKVLTALSIFACIITVSLNVVWIVKLLYQLRKSLKYYKHSKKRIGSYRPIYQDDESISQSVDLYNHKTDIIKFLVLIAVCALEIWQVSYTFLYRYIFLISPKLNNTNQRENDWLSCNYNIVKYIEHPYLLFLFSVETYGYLLLLFLLIVLTRFLSARSLLHPVRMSLIKYLAWLLIQLLLITIPSTTYTYPLYFFILPSLFLINLLLLVRESIVLRNVLKMNAVNKLMYSSNSRKFFRDQLLIYKHYKLFRMFLLLSLFVSFFLVILTVSSTGFKLVLCQTNGNTHLSAASELVMKILYNLEPLFTLLFLLSYGGPLWIYSVANIIIVLVRRYSTRNKQYRFNYSNTHVPLFMPLI